MYAYHTKDNYGMKKTIFLLWDVKALHAPLNEKKIMDIFPNSKFKNSINLSQSNLNSNLNY